ncbi:MAG: Cell shape-determining protein MreC [Parcubacteria group bacterium GW2011_GWC2_42_12]|nr:MAG: Cell shape-determining protein MreC [Parcubacteria group bacterium GW2011_GWC2_42_12]
MRLSWLRQISRSDDRAALSTRAARNDNKLFCRGNDILISMFKLNIKKYFTIIAVILLLLVLHYSKLLNPVESFLVQGLKPASKVFYSFSFGLSQTYFDQTVKVDLAAELKEARATINRLIAENVELKFLKEENLTLRKQLNFLAKSGERYLMANIISRGELEGDVANSRSVVIDKGLRDGLFAGLAVVSFVGPGDSSQGVIIGKIVNVKDNLAEIYLVTNKNCKLAAAILGEEKTSGIVTGELGLTSKMEFIPQTENIKEGDLVATSGLEQNIPRGLVIGRVTKVIKENNEVWQSATIEPQIDLDSLSVISVLLP